MQSTLRCRRVSCLSCCLWQAALGRGDGAGLEGAEARRRAVPGRAAGLHRPHQLLPGIHLGSHSGTCGCVRHAPRPEVILPRTHALQATVQLCVTLSLRSKTLFIFFSFSPQGPVSFHHGRPQPGLHAPLFSLFLPRAEGNACQLPGRLAAVPVSHFAGHPGPLPVRIAGLPAHSLAGLSMLAAFLEHPLLEVVQRVTPRVRQHSEVISGLFLLGECEELTVKSTGFEKNKINSCLGKNAPFFCTFCWQCNIYFKCLILQTTETFLIQQDVI